jgi:medium-chain acyl-[acyl-carrier-protein] hydrolase
MAVDTLSSGAPLHHEILFTVRASEAGPFGVIRLASFLNYFQEAAGEHAGLLGVSVHALLEQKLTWVLSRYHIKIDRYPVWGETVQMRTWPSTRRHLFALREFEAVAANGEVIARGTSSWMVIDILTKKPVRLDERLRDFPQEPARALADDFASLPVLSRTDFERTFFVRQGDLDWNRHANHVVYIEWAAEAAPPDAVAGFRPAEIEADYRGEARYGDVVHSRVEAAPSGAGPAFIHQVVREKDGAELARLRTFWMKA